MYLIKDWLHVWQPIQDWLHVWQPIKDWLHVWQPIQDWLHVLPQRKEIYYEYLQSKFF